MSAITANQFNLVYDVLSFSLATMMATTIFCWMRVGDVNKKIQISFDHHWSCNLHCSLPLHEDL